MTNARARRDRVVLDTNVIISALWDGPPRQIVDLWQNDEIHVIVSAEILTEYLKVLGRFNLPPETEEDFLLLFAHPERTVVVEPARTLKEIPEDPSDEKFLSCAMEGDADCIISGDRHLLNLAEFRGIPILKPSAYLAQRDRK